MSFSSPNDRPTDESICPATQNCPIQKEAHRSFTSHTQFPFHLSSHPISFFTHSLARSHPITHPSKKDSISQTLFPRGIYQMTLSFSSPDDRPTDVSICPATQNCPIQKDAHRSFTLPPQTPFHLSLLPTFIHEELNIGSYAGICIDFKDAINLTN